MIYRNLCLTAVLGMAVCFPVAFAEEKDKTEEKESKFTATCPVSGKDAVKEQSAAYREKEVYFCCEKCKAAFEADSAKFSTKANHQLVQTKQFRQKLCPVSGAKINKEQTSKVEGVKVSFCCEKCKGSIDSASKEEQLTKVFADDVFEKSFVAKKADKDKNEVSAEEKGT